MSFQKHISKNDCLDLMRRVMGWKPGEKEKMYNIRTQKGTFSCIIPKNEKERSGKIIQVNYPSQKKVFVFNFPISHLNKYKEQGLAIYFGTDCSPQEENIHWQYCVGYY